MVDGNQRAQGEYNTTVFQEAGEISKHPTCSQHTGQTCGNCKRPCRYCVPSSSVDCATSCESLSRTIGTDTMDLETPVVLQLEFKEESHQSSDSQCSGSFNYTEATSLPLMENIDVPKNQRKKYACPLCYKMFRTARGLKDHEPVHTGARDYICDICEKGYTTKANLMIHKRIHEGKKLFSCIVCGKSFHKKDSLKVHIRNHTGEKPYACDKCPTSFVRKSILQNHRLIHEKVKRYICSICGKRSSTISGLKYHEKTHAINPNDRKSRKPATKPSPSDSKAVLCQLCGKIYSNMSNFRSHELIHTGQKPFSCHICHRVYAKKDSLRIHQRTHNEQRLYPCNICDYAAYRNGTLKTHIMRHTGMRPYSCPQCPQTFTQASSLSYHIKHHNRINVTLSLSTTKDEPGTSESDLAERDSTIDVIDNDVEPVPI